MMHAHKKGVSPLIATVLLVGFVIALSGIIFIFIKGGTEEITGKTADKNFANNICNNEIEIKVLNAVMAGNVLRIEVENVKRREINDFLVRMEAENGDVELRKVSLTLGSYEVAPLPDIVPRKVSNVKVIKVIPQVVLEQGLKSVSRGFWPCSNKAIEYKIK
jgi:flagellin-like protein